MLVESSVVSGVDGATRWLLGDQLHRDDGPAIEFMDGTLMWFQHGLFHRVDGAAIEWAPPNLPWGWFIHGVEYSEDDYNLLMFMNCDIC